MARIPDASLALVNLVYYTESCNSVVETTKLWIMKDYLKNYLRVIIPAELFRDIEAADLETMLGCLGAEIKDVEKDGIVLLAGDRPTHVGMVLEGQLHVIRDDFDGNRTLIAAVAPGELFAEAFCCAGVTESPVSVVAAAPSRIMLMSFSRILHTCPSSCAHHAKLIENMLWIIANKTLMLHNRMEIVSMKSVRMKVLRFLESFAQKQGKDLTIPFNRDEMAEFLCVDRSALSHELMKMKHEGLIEYRKNRFKII